VNFRHSVAVDAGNLRPRDSWRVTENYRSFSRVFASCRGGHISKWITCATRQPVRLYHDSVTDGNQCRRKSVPHPRFERGLNDPESFVLPLHQRGVFGKNANLRTRQDHSGAIKRVASLAHTQGKVPGRGSSRVAAKYRIFLRFGDLSADHFPRQRFEIRTIPGTRSSLPALDV
jgi:hypothetical protein